MFRIGTIALCRRLRIVGLMTQWESVSARIRLKSSDQTFYDTQIMPQKTCVKIGRFVGPDRDG
jgi:hypothetical protein